VQSRFLRGAHDIGYLVLVYQIIDSREQYQDQFVFPDMTVPKRAGNLKQQKGQPGGGTCLGACIP